MTTESQVISVNGIDVKVLRKDIKHLHLGVYPPAGRVRVAAPLALSDDAIRLAVIDRLPWIKKHQASFVAQARESEREMVSGESHYYLGRRYRLRVIDGEAPGRVVLRGRTTLELHVPSSYDTDERRRVLERWYRQKLRETVPPLLVKWQEALGVQAADWRIKKMKTRWGSCTVEAQRIWLNLELAKKPAQCIEHLVVHELMHLLERHHNETFVALMDRHLPSWRLLRDTLNDAPLGHAEWTY